MLNAHLIVNVIAKHRLNNVSIKMVSRSIRAIIVGVAMNFAHRA